MEKTELFDFIRETIKDDKISQVAYAKIFSQMYFNGRPEKTAIHYVKDANEWRQGGTVLRELKILGLISNVCDMVRELIERDWEDSLFSVLLPERTLRKIYEDLDSMESLNSATNILDLAKGIMTTGNDGDFDWDSKESNDDYEDS